MTIKIWRVHSQATKLCRKHPIRLVQGPSFTGLYGYLFGRIGILVGTVHTYWRLRLPQAQPDTSICE